MFRSASRTALAALLAILLLAFGLRMVRIGSLLMWGDEGFSVYSANRDLVSISFESKDVDPHPPLYYYLLHLYLPVAGFSELSIRYLSVLFGTATVALVFVLGKKMFDARVGWAAAAVAAIAPFGVQYSQEVRMYALVMCLSALALWFFVKVAADRAGAPRKILWLGFFVAMFLTQYSLYQSAFIFVAQGVFLLPFITRRFRVVVRWLALSIAIVLLFVPWLLTHSTSALADIQDVAGATVPMNPFEFLARGLTAISAGPTIPLSDGLTVAALVAALISLGLIVAVATRRATQHDWLLVAFVVVPMALLYPIYWVAPLYRGRLFAVAFVPLMLLIARSASVLVARARLAAVPIALLVVGASGLSLNSYYFVYNRYSAAVEDYVPAIQDIAAQAQPGDEVLFHAYWQEGYFLSHYHGPPLVYKLLDNQTDVMTSVDRPRTVWAIVQNLAHHPSEDWLAQNAFALGEQQYGLMRVVRYRAGTPARGVTYPTPIAFDNGAELAGYHLNDAPVESGRGTVTLQLDWRAAHKIADGATIDVRLTDPQGSTVWAHAASAPSNGTQPMPGWSPGDEISDHHALSIPLATPPGRYAIQIEMMDTRTGSPVSAAPPGNPAVPVLTLADVDIARPSVPLDAPMIPHVLHARWGQIELAGLDSTPDQISAGDSLTLGSYWRAPAKPSSNYRLHVLLVDSAGAVRGWSSHLLPNDTFPTSAWNAGDLWRDRSTLAVEPGAAPAQATLYAYVTDEASHALVAPDTSAPTETVVSPEDGPVRAVRLGAIALSAAATPQ